MKRPNWSGCNKARQINLGLDLKTPRLTWWGFLLWLTFTLQHNSQVQDSVFRDDKTSDSFLPEVF
jgi:hypothetical protein